MKYELRCVECQKTYDQSMRVYACACGGKLDVRMNLSTIDFSQDELSRRDLGSGSVIEKYFEFLPLLDMGTVVNLGEGGTRLIRAGRLAEEIGFSHLYLKDETTNPTGSFKDRPIMVGLSKAREHGARIVAAASSGNAATSLAAGAAKAGLECIVFVPEEITESKAAHLGFYGAHVFRVKKSPGEDKTVAALRTLCEKSPDIIPVPSFGPFNPYQIEGAKTMAYEIVEQFGKLGETAAHVIVPVGGGGLFCGNLKGFGEYRALGFIEEIPRLHAIQPSRCAPLVDAYGTGGRIETWQNIDTVAGGLADPYTWDGPQVLEGIAETGGSAQAVEDEAILEAQKMLARYEGIFAEPSGAASLAGAMRLVERGTIAKDEALCCEITGSGFKDMGILQKNYVPPKLIEGDASDIERILSQMTI